MSINALRAWLIALALLLPGIALAAGAAKPEQRQDQELDEVLVEGQKAVRDPLKVYAWLARLVGQFAVDGTVDLHGGEGSGNPLEVQGRSNCVGFFPTQAVQCDLQLRWPEVKGPNGEQVLGGVSNLNPALMLYGYELDRVGIRNMIVDSKGIAEDAAGYLVSADTLVLQSKCVNVPGHCERVVHITADADLKQVEMKIDLEVEYQRAVSFRFVMHRVPGSPSLVYPGGKTQ